MHGHCAELCYHAYEVRSISALPGMNAVIPQMQAVNLAEGFIERRNVENAGLNGCCEVGGVVWLQGVGGRVIQGGRTHICRQRELHSIELVQQGLKGGQMVSHVCLPYEWMLPSAQPQRTSNIGRQSCPELLADYDAAILEP